MRSMKREPEKMHFRLVAPLYRFKTDDEAIKMTNDTEFGLAAYFYSRDIGRIWRVGEASIWAAAIANYFQVHQVESGIARALCPASAASFSVFSRISSRRGTRF